ncbi:hypothetical protein OKW38_003716 [Paraburkholderia sp. MM5496-R1]
MTIASSNLSPADAHRALVHDAAERDHADFCRAAADVDDHRTRCFRHRQARADRGSHRFFDQIHLRGARAVRGFLDRATLDLGRTARHADDDPRRRREHARFVSSLDELLDHLLGDGEVGDHAIFHRADRLDVARHLAEHLLGFLADCLNGLLAVGAAFLADRHDRRFVENDALAAHVDKGVGGAEVNRQIVREVAAQKTEHSKSCLAGGRASHRMRRAAAEK